jgi:hypothetical protein
MSDRYPLRLGPFVVVARLIEEAVPEIGLAFSRRARRVRPCLLKHVRLAKSGSEDLQEAFLRANRLSRRLSHSGLARAFAVGRLEGRLFLAEAFRPGVLLSQLPAAPMPVATAAFVARELAAALDFLHRFEGEGLCHRRLSPEQVLLSFQGEVRLLDGPFAGSSKRKDAPFARAMRPPLRFVPPEIAAGEAGDARSDLYMLGVLLWEMLAGRRYESMPTVSRGSGPLTLADEIPVRLRDLVARLLAASPSERPADAGVVRRALSAFAPWSWTGRRGLARLIAASVDVRQQLDQLRKWQHEARALLPKGPSDGSEAPAAAAARTGDLWSRRLLVPVAVGAAGMMALLLAWQPRERPSEAPAPETAVPYEPPPIPEPAEQVPAAPPAPAPAATAPHVQPAPTAPGPGPITAQQPAAPVPEIVAPETETPPVRRLSPQAQAEARAQGEAALEKAEVRFQYGDFEAAERLVREASVALPRSPRPHYLLGLILLARGAAAEAASAFARTIELDPNYSDAARKLRLAQERASIK